MNAFITAQGFTTFSMVSVLIGAVCNYLFTTCIYLLFSYGGTRCCTGNCYLTGNFHTLGSFIPLRQKDTASPQEKASPSGGKGCSSLHRTGTCCFYHAVKRKYCNCLLQFILLRYGGDIAVGAMTILTSVMQFAMLPLQGIAQGAQPISSYNYGAKNADRVKKTFRLLLITCLSYSVLLWAAVQLVPRVFVSIFTADTSLIEFTAPMLKIYLGGLFLFGIQIACQMTFTSLGKAVNSIIVAVVRKFVLLIPLIYIMPHMISDSTTGVYMAEPIADITAVIFTSVLFTFQFKKALAEIQN